MKNLHKSVGIFSLSMFAAATAAYIYSPVIGSHADTSATADINLNVGEVLNLTLDTNSLDLSTTINSFVSGTINATASTNSQYGYTLTLEDVDANTNLVHTNENIDATVASNFSGSKTSSEMEDNTWGFSLNTTDFYKVPVNGSPVALKRTNVPMTTESETTPVTFGAKVGNLTSGTYTDKILFTLYTNGQDEPDTMQAFNCDALPNVNDSMVLTDTRDGNEYTVKKLADEKCWMTENLRLTNKSISSADSNLQDGTSWTVPASDISSFVSEGFNANSVYYDSSRGAYYNFYAATAGTGGTDNTTGNAPSDICPKGWKLPTGASYGDFQTLNTIYNGAEFKAAPFIADGFDYTGGRATMGAVYGDDEEANYWSSTIMSSTHAYYMALHETDSYPLSYRNKYVGQFVRCIAKN